MDRNGNSVWHAGGTRAPLLMKRAGPAAGIRHPRATGVVPLRATGGRFEDAKDPARGIFHPSGVSPIAWMLLLLSSGQWWADSFQDGGRSSFEVGVGAGADLESS